MQDSGAVSRIQGARFRRCAPPLGVVFSEWPRIFCHSKCRPYWLEDEKVRSSEDQKVLGYEFWSNLLVAISFELF